MPTTIKLTDIAAVLDGEKEPERLQDLCRVFGDQPGDHRVAKLRAWIDLSILEELRKIRALLEKAGAPVRLVRLGRERPPVQGERTMMTPNEIFEEAEEGATPDEESRPHAITPEVPRGLDPVPPDRWKRGKGKR